MVIEAKAPLMESEPKTEDTESQVTETAAETEISKEEKGVAPETLSFKTQSELDAHIEKESTRRATIIADKGLVTYQQRENELKAQLKQAQQAQAEKKEDDILARLEKKQAEVYEGEPDLPDFQEAEKELLKQVRQFRKDKTEWDDNHGKLTEEVREALAFRKALGVYLVPEDSEELFSTVKALAKKLVEAKTDAEMDLMVALEEEKLKRLAEATPNTREAKPDSALGTAPGGVDITKLDGHELLKRAFAKELKR